MASKQRQSVRGKRPAPQREVTGFEDLQNTAVGVFTRNSILAGFLHFYLERITSAGRWFLYPTFLFALVGTFTLEHQVHVACLFSAALWFVAWVWMLGSKPNVALTARYPDRAGAGETVVFDIAFENKRFTPLYDIKAVPHRWHPALEVNEDSISSVARLTHGKTAHSRLTVHCSKRGVYNLRGIRVQSDFPFGLMVASTVYPAPHQLLVYPEFTALMRMEIETGRKYHPGGVALASKLGESFEYIGNREYREGDNIRDLDWIATARLGRPIIREYREEYFHRVAVVLDTHVPKKERSVQSEAFERAVSLTAAIGDYMARQEYLVDIFAAGPDLYHLTAGRSLAYLDQILDILACVNENPNEPFETLEPAILEHLSQITTVICVFMDWNSNRQAFVQRIASNGAGVKVVIARDLPLTMDPMADPTLGRVPVIDAAAYSAGVEVL